MPLDRRVRDGLAEAAASFTPDVEEHLARTRRQFRRRRTTNRAVLAAAAVAAAVAVVPLSRAVLPDRGTVAVPSDAEARTALRHTWQGPTVSREEVRSTLAAAGLAAYGDTVVVEADFPTAWTLSIRPHGYDVRSARGVQVDTGTWTVDGRVLTLLPSQCPCRLTFRWSVTGDRLRLRLVDDASPAVDGVPDEAFARAVYTAAAFTRQPPRD